MRGRGLLLWAMAAWVGVVLSPGVGAADLPDLTPEVLQVPAAITGAPNPSVTVAWGVSNRGLGAATGAWCDQLYFSSNFVLDGADPLVGRWTELGPVASGDSYWRMNTVQVPVTKDGTYYLIFKTAAEHTLVESDPDDNIVAAPITFTLIPPDLAPVALQAPKVVTGAPNPTVTLVWGVTNQGTMEARGYGWRDEVYVSTNGALEGSLGAWSGVEIGPVAAGGSYWRTNDVTVPVTRSGTNYLIFKTDAINSLGESDLSNNWRSVPVIFDITSADLTPVVTAISNEVTGAPNFSLGLSWGVTNQGSGAALGLWQDRVYLSTDAVLDAQDVLLGGGDRQRTLGAGESYQRADTVQIPVQQSGTYYFIFATGVGGAANEPNQLNNVAVVPVTVHILLPDFVPLAVQPSTVITGAPGVYFSLAWGVTNQGASRSAGAFGWYRDDRVYFSTDPVLDSKDLILDYHYGYLPVAAGDSAWWTNVMRIPAVASGTYYLICETDVFHMMDESNESNNVVVVPVTFQVQWPDLRPLALDVPTTVTGPPNPGLTITSLVTNQGLGSSGGAWTDKVYLSTNAVLDGTDIYLMQNAHCMSLSTGASYANTNRIHVPVVASGTYYLILVTDSYNNVREEDETNNTLVVPVTFQVEPPDLAPVALWMTNPITVPPSPTVTLVWGVTNQGIGQALPAWAWTDRVYLSTDPVLDQGDRYLLERAGQTVAAGASYWATNTVELPVSRSGTYYLILVTDPINSLDESNESNNTLVVSVTLNVQDADLVPVVPQMPAWLPCSTNQNMTLRWTVTNQGPATAVGWWHDRVYFSTDSVIDSWDRLLCDDYQQRTLEAGGSYERADWVRIPVPQSGTYYLIFAAGFDSALYEQDRNNNVVAVPVTFELQLPDLVPVVQPLPAVVTGPAKPNVTLVWGVTNQGPGALEDYWSDRVCFSADPVLDSLDEIIISQGGNGLPAGGSVWWTNKVELPVVNSGTYYLIFAADADHGVYEFDKTNNLLVVPVTFNVQWPDLTPMALQVPTVVTGPPNPSLTLTWAVTNQGPGAASGPWYDWVYVSTNAVRDGTEALVLQHQQNLTLAAGDSYSVTNRVRLPIVHSGDYYLLFVTDAWNGCRESEESNNTLAVPVAFLVEPPELAPLAMLVANTDFAATNPTVTLVWGVTNQGPGLAEASGNWIDRVSISTNAVLDNRARVLCASEGITVAAGESYWQTNRVPLPLVQSGTYYLFLEMDPAHFLHEANISNNILRVPITLDVPSPDLAPVYLSVPSFVHGGRNPSVTVTWGVANKGNASIGPGAHWVDALYCSTDPVLDWWDSCIAASAEWGPVAPGTSYWRTNAVQLPATQSGSYYLIFKTDGDGNLFESNENNNAAAMVVAFELQLPDLLPVVQQVPAVVTGGANPNVTLVWGVTNQGAGAPEGGRADRVYFSTDPVLDSGDQLLCSEFGTAPPAGSSVGWTNTVALPVIESGPYYLIFAADANHEVYESSETNNLLAVPVTCNVQLPDLIPIAVRVPTVVNGPTNPSLSLSWAVTNQGGGPALGGWADQVYFSTNPVLDGTAVRLLNLLREEPLAAGQSCWSTNTVRLPVTQSGTYYLFLAADAKNSLYESDEANNTVVVPVKYEFTPSDLAPLVQVAPSGLTGTPNPRVTLVWGATNQGNVATSGAWHDQVYLSRDPRLDLQALPLCAEPWQGALEAGETYWHTNEVTLPLNASGTYYLLFVTDVTQELAEFNESNNVVAVPLTFDLLAPDLVPVVLSVPTVVTGPPNLSVTLLWGVTNTGAGHTSTARVDRVYLSTDVELDNADGCLISQWAMEPMAAGDSVGWSNSVRFPVTQNGTYYLIFQADADNAVYELSKSNNLVVVPVTIEVQLPDLMPVMSPGPLKLNGPANPSVELAWGVTNQGVGTALGSWSDRVYFSTNAVLDWTATRLVDSLREEPLAAGQSYCNTNTVPLPVSESGTYYLIFAANAKNALYESDEANNTVVVPVEVTVRTDVTIGGGTFLDDGSFQLAISGAIGGSYILQASPDLGNWSDVVNFTCVETPTYVVDPSAKDFGQRFYRVAVPAKPN